MLSSDLFLGWCLICVGWILPAASAAEDDDASAAAAAGGGCWGYEPDCAPGDRRWRAACDGDSRGWTRDAEAQAETFFQQADFGYVGSRRQTLRHYCSAEETAGAGKLSSSSESWLQCTDHMQFCRGDRLWLDLRPVAERTDNLLYKMDVLRPGGIGGDCVVDADRLRRNADEISPLQSWGPEVRNFVGRGDGTKRARDPRSGECDLTFDRPVYVMKLDAEVNMYHHFCDFFNLFASLHLNDDGTLVRDAWTKDVQILLWQSIPYRSNFGLAWQAFTRHPLLTLSDLAGKRVCFNGGVMFPLLPRMIFGLYYNTPLIPGCSGSGLFKEFNRFMTRHLVTDGGPGAAVASQSLSQSQSPSPSPAPAPASASASASAFGPENPVRVTFLSRLTRHRRVVNEEELLSAVRRLPRVALTRADFTFRTPFADQLALVAARTDVLVGMHGSGLTHALFLPDWAAVFELYNCGDADCYADLARLRGLTYRTWPESGFGSGSGVRRVAEDADRTVGGHEKFANYSFDVDVFKRVVAEIVDSVSAHPAFPNLTKHKVPLLDPAVARKKQQQQQKRKEIGSSSEEL